MLRLSYDCVTTEVRLCYACVTTVSGLCYDCVTTVLRLCYACATAVLRLCYGCVTPVLRLCYGWENALHQGLGAACCAGSRQARRAAPSLRGRFLFPALFGQTTPKKAAAGFSTMTLRTV